MTDCKSHKVVVKGDKADPLKVLERVQRKTHRQVELLSPIPNPAEEEKKPEPEEEKKKEEVLNLVSHFNFSFESVECCFNFPFFFFSPCNFNLQYNSLRSRLRLLSRLFSKFTCIARRVHWRWKDAYRKWKVCNYKPSSIFPQTTVIKIFDPNDTLEVLQLLDRPWD